MLNDAVLAEYKSVRSEIEQLNGQIFVVLSSSLALNVTVLGWLFVKDSPSKPYVLPTIGILLLFFGTIILLNRNRLAHRLALFQKYFIESRISDICWGRIYFEYRAHYIRRGIITQAAERLAESGTYVLFTAGAINICILIILGLWPYFENGSMELDWKQLANIVVASALLGLQLCVGRVMTNYRAIDLTMRRLAMRCGLNRPKSTLSANPAVHRTLRDKAAQRR